MKQIYALVGDYWHQGGMIEEALRQVEGRLDGVAVACIEPGELLDRLQEKPAAVVLFKSRSLNAPKEPLITWMTGEMESAIVRYVEDGGSWLAWHTGMAGYDKEGAYIGMLRGHFIHHPAMKAVKYTDAATGEAWMTLHDEHYFVHVETEQTDVYLTSSSEDGEQIAGWAHSFGQGKVCCLTPAHTRESLLDPRFQQLLAERLRLLV